MNRQKKVSLKKLLRTSFFKTTLIPIIVIEVTLLILYFGISNFMIDKGKLSLEHEIKTNLDAILSKEVQEIDFQLKEVSELAAILQDDQQLKFQNKDRLLKIQDDIKFKYAKNGVYYKEKDNGGSSVFYGTNHKIEQEQIQKALFTESFDPMLKYVVDNNNLIVASYFNSYDDMNRLYPFITDVHSQYDPSINMEDYNFYYDADKEHNPNKEPVWTNAYLDPAGQGWMVSCVVPIYSKEFLEGVTGLDVTINNFVKNTLNLKLPWEGNGFLVAKDGTILAMPEKVERLLGLQELKNHEYTDVIKQTNFKPEDLNIKKNPNVAHYFKEILKNNQFLTYKTIKNNEYIIAQKDIEQTGWKLFIIVDKGSVYKPINDMEELAKNIGLLAIIGMILFYIIFFFFISRKVQKIAYNISTPISKLAHTTQTISKTKKEFSIEHNNIKEIELLLKNFQLMTNDLFTKREELEELNTNLEQIVIEEIKKNKDKENALLHQSRLAQLGEMISMIAHQWRQPLASISSIAIAIKLKIRLKNYQLDTKEAQDDFIQYIDNEINDIESLTQSLTTTIDDFRDFYKPNKEAVYESITVPIEKSLTIIKHEMQQNGIKLIKEYEPDILQKKLHINELIQVFLNLFQNSLDAFKEHNVSDPTIHILVQNKGDDHIEIKINDNGGGISNDIMENIFVPYFSTKNEKNGTGLGLYMSKTIIEKHHGGKIDVISNNKNTSFIITL